MQKQSTNINKGATKPVLSQTRQTSAAQMAPKQQTKAEQPKHNMTVIELSTPHQKLPGVQRYTAEDLRIMVERAKQFPQVHEGYYLQIMNYDFQVDEWELETGNSQPHSDESKLAMRPKTAVTSAQRRQEQAKKSKETREEMAAKLDNERNPTFKRPVTAGGVGKGKGNGDKNSNKIQKNEDEEEKKENILENKSECKSENEEEEEDQNQENDNQNDGEDVVNTDEDNKDGENNGNQEDQENEDQNNQNQEQNEDEEEENQRIQSKKIIKTSKNVKVTQEAQTNKQTKKEQNQEIPAIKGKTRVPVVISQKDKQRRVNNQDIVDNMDDDDDNMTGNSFEKMSLHSSKASEKANVKQAVKGPYKSDVANVRIRINNFIKRERKVKGTVVGLDERTN